MSPDAPFLRSINIKFDAETPERIAHYVPTSKCVPLISSLLARNEKSSDTVFFIVAPYGSGKSLSALYLLHLLEKQPGAEKVLESIIPRLHDVDADLALYASRRFSNRQKGLAITLHGHVSNLPEAIKDATIASLYRAKLGREARTFESFTCDNLDDVASLFKAVRDKFPKKAPKGKGYSLNNMVILWDEFGKHLETILVEGHPNAFLEIQTLAEIVSRARSVDTTLGLFLHQGLLQYAHHMSQTVRLEWAKIEGRFKTIQYVDDSKEIYRLICEVSARREKINKPNPLDFLSAAKSAKDVGLFHEIEVTQLQQMLENSYPLTTTTLYLLPRIAARIAQNERTLFDFLYHASFDQEIEPWDLYDYFSHQMRSDVSVGGTYRRWLETQSAISKADGNDNWVKALKTASLLGLGLAGDRSRTSRELLTFALSGYGQELSGKMVIEDLIDRKLLLYRKHNDEVAVWHGTDLDLRGRLEDLKQRHNADFDLLEFIRKDAETIAWRPVEYNSKVGVRRYLRSEFNTNESLEESYLSEELFKKALENDSDGKVLYLIATDAESLRQARKNASKKGWDERLVIAVPQEAVPLDDAALEVWCLEQMRMDGELTSSDPMALPEIEQLIEDARGHLQRLIDRCTVPSRVGPTFYHEGKDIHADSPRDLRRNLSQIMYKVFSKTPVIYNENIVRRNPTGIMVNARKKLLIGILERSGQENLGLQGNFPDSSVFRTVLLHTGLYHSEGGRWCYRQPEELGDSSLSEVWGLFRSFLTDQHFEHQSFDDFFKCLKKKPYGIRSGVFPILLAAALKAFPSVVAIKFKGEYLYDIMPTTIEDICKNPTDYTIDVFELTAERKAYLEGILDVFMSDAERGFEEKDFLRKSFDAVDVWLGQLPKACEMTHQLDKETAQFRDLVYREGDPNTLFFKGIPELLKCKISQVHKVKGKLSQYKINIEDVVDGYYASAREAMLSGFSWTNKSIKGKSLSLLCTEWAECFTDDFIAELPDAMAKGFLSRISSTYDTDENLLDSISSQITGKAIPQWYDNSVLQFSQGLCSIIRKIEDYALNSASALKSEGNASVGVAKLAKGRLEEIADRLISLVGKEDAKSIFAHILKDIDKRN